MAVHFTTMVTFVIKSGTYGFVPIRLWDFAQNLL